jgi:septal ring factor EnvC (AmiA/AmiB activator)
MDPGGPDPRDSDGDGSTESVDQGVGAAADMPQATNEAPSHVETDTPIDTEAVDVPPVTIATVDRPAGPRRVSGRVAAVVGVLAALAVGGVAYAGYTLNQDLAATRTTLATTESDLGSTQTELDETSSTLATTKATLAERTTEREAFDAEITDLSAQVATQTECVDLQEEALAELIRISDLQTENFNRTAEGSAWDTAELKRADWVEAALDEFYAAYTAAFEGATGTAKAHSDKGKAAQAKIAEAEAQEIAELNLVDTKAAEIQVLIDALERELVSIQSTCEGVAP